VIRLQSFNWHQHLLQVVTLTPCCKKNKTSALLDACCQPHHRDAVSTCAQLVKSVRLWPGSAPVLFWSSSGILVGRPCGERAFRVAAGTLLHVKLCFGFEKPALCMWWIKMKPMCVSRFTVWDCQRSCSCRTPALTTIAWWPACNVSYERDPEQAVEMPIMLSDTMHHGWMLLAGAFERMFFFKGDYFLHCMIVMGKMHRRCMRIFYPTCHSAASFSIPHDRLVRVRRALFFSVGKGW